MVLYTIFLLFLALFSLVTIQQSPADCPNSNCCRHSVMQNSAICGWDKTNSYQAQCQNLFSLRAIPSICICDRGVLQRQCVEVVCWKDSQRSDLQKMGDDDRNCQMFWDRMSYEKGMGYKLTNVGEPSKEL
ncbi:hypothetical protein N431DRAFT_483666 [Stipitochalara longipes BDJ]|nr:hypothetical protein N431DRAFT_483666 [Stipitochalara longipes BDJ]